MALVLTITLIALALVCFGGGTALFLTKFSRPNSEVSAASKSVAASLSLVLIFAGGLCILGLYTLQLIPR